VRCKYDSRYACNFGRKCYSECPFLPSDLRPNDKKLDSFIVKRKEKKKNASLPEIWKNSNSHN